jgi:undecaprenyl diphosphate synthase
MPSPLDPQQELGLARERLPRHVAIIMDGNGRWANQRGRERIFGHLQGAANVRAIVTHAARLGLDALTLYSFSTENWRRPKAEVDALMDLYVEYLIRERQTVMENNVRLIQVGRREGLPEPVLRELDVTQQVSAANTGLTLCLAINYGARLEIVDAVRRIAEQVRAGRLEPASIEEATITAHLYTAGVPDPDLLIRTAGEMRISNFLLWQISYAELYVSQVLWPDFSTEEFNAALRSYAARQRRFGGVADGSNPPG